MPYTAIVIEEHEDDWDKPDHDDFLNSKMTLGLSTIDEMADYADKIAASMKDPMIRILDMQLEPITEDRQYIAMTRGSTIGRRVVFKYGLFEGKRYVALDKEDG